MCESNQRIALVDEDEVVFGFFASALRQRSGAATAHNVAFSHAANGFDLVLYDAPAHGDRGWHELATFTRRHRTPLAVFTKAASVDVAIGAMRLGAAGLVSKSTTPQSLSVNVDLLLAGHHSIDANVAGELARTVASNPAMSWTGMAQGLTRREGEVLDLLRGGLTNREIADRLTVGMQTVKSHAHTIYRKLGLSGRAALLS